LLHFSGGGGTAKDGEQKKNLPLGVKVRLADGIQSLFLRIRNPAAQCGFTLCLPAISIVRQKNDIFGKVTSEYDSAAPPCIEVAF
jgi:hypothetical protein